MFAHSLLIIETYLKMKPRSHLNLSLTHHLVQKRLKTENTCYIVVLFLGGFLTLVTLFSEEFSDFIKEVKKKAILLFLGKKGIYQQQAISLQFCSKSCLSYTWKFFSN